MFEVILQSFSSGRMSPIESSPHIWAQVKLRTKEIWHTIQIQSCLELDFEHTNGFLTLRQVRRYKIEAKQTSNAPPRAVKSFNRSLTKPLTALTELKLGLIGEELSKV